MLLTVVQCVVEDVVKSCWSVIRVLLDANRCYHDVDDHHL